MTACKKAAAFRSRNNVKVMECPIYMQVDMDTCSWNLMRRVVAGTGWKGLIHSSCKHDVYLCTHVEGV